MFELDGKVAVVTAGCAGIGLEVARLFCRLGATVVVTTRSARTANARNAEWKAAGLAISAREASLSSSSIEALVADVADTFGGLHLLVNCAGGRFAAKPVEATEPDDLRKEFEASVATAFECSRAAVQARERTEIESIVNIGSIYGVLAVDHRIYPDPGRQTPIAYACAKSALVQMTRYLAAYWAPLKIRVNCVSPGGVARGQSEDFLSRYCARVPMARLAEASEVAGAVAFLASEASSYVTGENLMVDGGLHAW